MKRRKWEFPVSLCVLAVYITLYMGAGEGWIIPRKIALMAQLPPWLTSLGNLLVALCTFLLLTALFGRWYCRVLCPAGAVQEIFSRIGGKFRLRKLRYVPAKGGWSVLFFTGIASIVGFYALAQTIDPLGLFGRTVMMLMQAGRSFAWNGEMLLFLTFFGLLFLFVLPLFRGRMLCDQLCPVGAILGVTASLRKGRPVPGINSEKCVSCGKCETVCPVRCVDPAGKNIETVRCLECGKCASVCAPGAIETHSGAAMPKERRSFLHSAAAVGAAGIFFLSRPISALFATEFRERQIAPPGTGGDIRHQQHCIGCMACVPACPMRIITPMKSHSLPRPTLDYDLGFCHYNCRACLDSCPAGAFDSSLTLEQRQRVRVARVTLDLPQCVVLLNNTGCGACAEVCPTHALQMVEQGEGKPTIPNFAPEYCIGCGACYHACPAEPRAFIMQGLATHETSQGIRPSIAPLAPEAETPAYTLPEPGELTDFPF